MLFGVFIRRLYRTVDTSTIKAAKIRQRVLPIPQRVGEIRKRVLSQNLSNGPA